MERIFILAVGIFCLSLLLAVQAFGQGTGGAPVLSSDIYITIMQGGAFALLVYLIVWWTRDGNARMDKQTAAIERNTDALMKLDADWRADREENRFRRSTDRHEQPDK